MLAVAQLALGGVSLLVLASMIVGRAIPGQGSVRGILAVGTLALGGILAESSTDLERADAQALTAVLFLYAVGVIVWTHRDADLRPATPGAVSLLALWVWLFAVDATSGSIVGATAWAGRAASGVLLVAVIHLARWQGITVRTFATVLSTAMAVIGLASAVMTDPWRSCDQFKCGYLGALLTGPFSSENYVGILAAWTCLLALLGLAGARRWASLALGAAFLVATGARSSMYAIAVVIVILLLLERFPRISTRDRGEDGVSVHPVLVAGTLLTGFGTAMVLLFTATPTTLSNRGNIWVSALEQLDGHFLTGLGLDRWEPLTRLGLLPAHFPHNGYLLLLFSGGAVAIGLLAILLAAVLLKPVADGRAALGRLAMVHLFLIISLTEVVWNPLTIDGLSWTILCILAGHGTVLSRRGDRTGHDAVTAFAAAEGSARTRRPGRSVEGQPVER